MAVLSRLGATLLALTWQRRVVCPTTGCDPSRRDRFTYEQPPAKRCVRCRRRMA